ncbi:MAG: response regulator [Patescibacteria group bacterium]
MSKKVLLVDSSYFLALLKAIMEDEWTGSAVELCNPTTEELEAELMTREYWLVITGCNMPRIQGKAVLELSKKYGCKTILLSVDDPAEETKKTADCFLPKEIGFEEKLLLAVNVLAETPE